MIKVAPSILTADFANLENEVKAVEMAGADWLHLDVMDGHFVPNLTFGPAVIHSLRDKTSLYFDVHLMIADPQNFIEEFAKAGADIITVHVEACPHLHRVIQQIKRSGKKAGVALNPGTPLNSIEWLLSEIDLILLMSVNPGFGGQQFIESTIKKISLLKDMLEGEKKRVEIEVDGGINDKTARKVVDAGATVLVAGSAIFSPPSVAKNMERLRQSI